MNRLKIELPRKLMNRKHWDKEIGNTEIKKDLEIEIHCKFGIHENIIKRKRFRNRDSKFGIDENKIKRQ